LGGFGQLFSLLHWFFLVSLLQNLELVKLLVLQFVEEFLPGGISPLFWVKELKGF